MTLVALLSPAPFPYGGAAFDSFVRESYTIVNRKDPGEFYRVMDSQPSTVAEWTAAHRADGSAIEARIAAESAWRRVKRTIAKFSLDRGFEFANVARTGERQCFLQSVLVSSLLQKAGHDAGVAMVWCNPKGQTSNNGHAVALLRTESGDLVVDCSEPYPFERHRGLFLRQGASFRFVRPIYDERKWIRFYAPTRAEALPTTLPRDYETLDMAFLRSQFDYYRGERSTGGILAETKSPAGLAASARFFRKGLTHSSANPLLHAMLGRTLTAMGKHAAATVERQRALDLYRTYGWTPANLLKPQHDALAPHPR